MKIKSPIFTASVMCAAMTGFSHAFVLVSFDMETVDTNPDSDINRSATASVVHSSITSGTLDAYPNGSNNPGDFGVDNVYESSGWSTFSARGLNETPYWQFTVTPEAGETILLASLSFDGLARMTLSGGIAEVDYVLRWSGDSFATPLATIAGPQANATNQNVLITGLSADLSSLDPQTSAFTLRLEVVNKGGTNGVWSQRGGGIDNLTLNAVPKPAVTLLGSLGVLALLRRRRDAPRSHTATASGGGRTQLEIIIILRTIQSNRSLSGMRIHQTKTSAALALIAAGTAIAPAATLKFSDFDLAGDAADITLSSGPFAFDPDYTYAESPANPSNARVQDAPFNNGGTLFLAAAAAPTQQTLSLSSSTFVGPSFDTTETLNLEVDVGSNFLRSESILTSGLYFGGTTASVLVTWSPDSSTFSAGVWSGIGAAIPTDLVDTATLDGGASFPAVGNSLTTVSFGIIENGTNYDVTFDVGGGSNSFSVPIASLGDIHTVGMFNNVTDGGNSNFDNLTLSGAEPPAIDSLYWDGLASGGLNGVNDEWDSTTANWNPADDFSETATTWEAGGNATLSGTGGPIQLTETIEIGLLNVLSPGYSLTGASLLINNNAEFLINEDLELAATMTGSGDVTKNGAGRLTLSGDGSGFTGSFSNISGETTLGSPDWSSTDFTVNGGLLRADHSGTLTLGGLALSGDLFANEPTRIDLVNGILNQSGTGGWMNFDAGQNPGRLTSSGGTLTFNFVGNITAAPRLYLPLEDFDGGDPMEVVVDVETPGSGRGRLDVFSRNDHTGGTTIRNGRWGVRQTGSFGTGPVVVNDGGQVYAISGDISNPLTIAGLGTPEPPGLLGALRLENNGTVSGDITVDPAGSRIVAWAGANGRISGNLLGAGDLEINFEADTNANGTVNLNGNTESYTGTIIVPRGRLNLTGPLGGSLVVEDPGTASLGGSLGGSLTLGSAGGAGTSLALDVADGPIAVTDLTLNGSNALDLRGLPVPGAPVPLFTYSGTLADDATPGDPADNLTVLDPSAHRQAIFSDAGGTVQVDIAHEASVFTADISDFWSVGAIDDNWSSSDGFFYNGDSVTFDDTVSLFFSGTVTLDGEPVPSSITVDNLTLDYTFTGNATNRITGGGGLLKSGTATLTMNAPNTFSGGTVIRGGTVQVRQADALGSGDVTLGDGLTGAGDVALYLDANRVSFTRQVNVSGQGAGTATLGSRASIGGIGDNNQFTDIVLERDAVFDSNADDRTDYENISGTGNITVTGAGRSVFVTNGMPWTGDLTVDGGLLQIGTASPGGDRLPDTTRVNLVNSGTIRISTAAETIAALDGDASGIIDTNQPAGGSAVLTIGAGDAGGSFAGTLSETNGTLALTKIGAGTQVLSGSNTYLGATTITGGVLSLATPSTLSDEGEVVINGGVLDLDFSGREVVATLLIDGVIQPGGTYGATGSGADHIDDTRFSGTGMLEVGGTDDPYAQYEADNQIVGAGPDADSDGDGLANGIEFVLGGISDPAANRNDLDLLPTFSDDGGEVTFSFRLSDSAASISPAVWAVEFNTDLSTSWTTASDPGNATISITPDAVEPFSTVDVTLPKPPEGRIFARLKVTIP